MLVVVAVISLFAQGALSKSAPACTWDSKSGAKYDLRALTLTSGTTAYEIRDGDIPCTPETEPTFNYIWNYCANVPPNAVPQNCIDGGGKTGVVLQWVSYPNNGGDFCYTLAHDENAKITYSLLDPSDPSKGISISYPTGEKCDNQLGSSILRSAVIDVKCANVEHQPMFAQEPSLCAYHMEVESYYGCPTECEVTKDGGLCDAHGHCAYDYVSKKAYCYCNEGYSGSDCSSKTQATTSYDGFSVQLALLIVLLLVAAGLTAGIAYMAFQISEYRKHQISNNYKSLAGGEAEMTESINFRH
jgi:hypothetical protein